MHSIRIEAGPAGGGRSDVPAGVARQNATSNFLMDMVVCESLVWGETLNREDLSQLRNKKEASPLLADGFAETSLQKMDTSSSDPCHG